MMLDRTSANRSCALLLSPHVRFNGVRDALVVPIEATEGIANLIDLVRIYLGRLARCHQVVFVAPDQPFELLRAGAIAS